MTAVVAAVALLAAALLVAGAPRQEVALSPSVSGGALEAGSWQRYAPPPSVLAHPGAIVVAGGSIVVNRSERWPAIDGPDAVFPTTARYDVSRHEWTTMPRPPTDLALPVVAATPSAVVLVGGRYGSEPSRQGLLIEGGRWRRLPSAPFAPGSAALASDAIIVVEDAGDRVAELDTQTWRWHSLPSLPPLDPLRARPWSSEVVADRDGDAWVFRTFEPTSGAVPVTQGFRLADGAWHSAGTTAVGTATGIAITPYGPIGAPGPRCPALSACMPDLEAVAVRYEPDLGWVPSRSERHGSVSAGWTGQALVLGTGGTLGVGAPSPPVAWEPATDTWTELPTPPAQLTALVWAGDRLVGWSPDGTFELEPGSDRPTVRP